MKTKQILFTLAFSIGSIISANAQTTFEVPKNVELKVADDYAQYEQDVIDGSKWIENTDLNMETAKRKKVNAFLMEWMIGSPTITIEVDSGIMDLTKDNAELLIIFMAGYFRNFIENKNTATKFTATKAGLVSIMNVYQKGISIEKNKKMEKVIALYEKGKIDDYINDNMMGK